MMYTQLYCPVCGEPLDEDEWDFEYNNFEEIWYCPCCDWYGSTNDMDGHHD